MSAADASLLKTACFSDCSREFRLDWTPRDLCLSSYRRIITRRTVAVHAPPACPCPFRGRPRPCQSGGDLGGLARASRHHYLLVETSACPDRQTVHVIYVHSILSVLSAGRIPRRLLVLIKKSAHEIVGPLSHVSIQPNGTRFFYPFLVTIVSFALFLYRLH